MFWDITNAVSQPSASPGQRTARVWSTTRRQEGAESVFVPEVVNRNIPAMPWHDDDDDVAMLWQHSFRTLASCALTGCSQQEFARHGGMECEATNSGNKSESTSR